MNNGYFIICLQCNHNISVSDMDVGIICRHCGKYNGDVMDRRITFDDFITDDYGENAGGAPHIPNIKLLKFRDGMEKKAYEWREKQSRKKHRKFGPINTSTGEHLE